MMRRRSLAKSNWLAEIGEYVVFGRSVTPRLIYASLSKMIDK